MHVTPGIAQLLLEQVAAEKKMTIAELPAVVTLDPHFFSFADRRNPCFMGIPLTGVATWSESPLYPGKATLTVNVERLRAIAEERVSFAAAAAASHPSIQGSMGFSGGR